MAVLLYSFCLSACAQVSPFVVMQRLLGYIPPPVETSVGEELKREFQRCEKIDPTRNCVRIAIDVVRAAKGLDKRRTQKGTVTILEGDIEIDQ